MSEFTEQIAADVADLFLNTEELAELRTVNGIDAVPVIMRTAEAPEGERWTGQGRALLSVTMAIDALPAIPAIGDLLTIDGVQYPVVSVRGRHLLKLVVEEIGHAPTETATVIHYTRDGWAAPVETERERAIPCRYLTAEELRRVDDGELARATAAIAFPADSGLGSLSIGDEVIIAETTYAVAAAKTERDAGGRVTRILAALNRIGAEGGY